MLPNSRAPEARFLLSHFHLTMFELIAGPHQQEHFCWGFSKLIWKSIYRWSTERCGHNHRKIPLVVHMAMDWWQFPFQILHSFHILEYHLPMSQYIMIRYPKSKIFHLHVSCLPSKRLHNDFHSLKDDEFYILARHHNSKRFVTAGKKIRPVIQKTKPHKLPCNQYGKLSPCTHAKGGS